MDGWHLLPLRGNELKPQAREAPGCLPWRGVTGGWWGAKRLPTIWVHRGSTKHLISFSAMAQKCSKLVPLVLDFMIFQFCEVLIQSFTNTCYHHKEDNHTLYKIQNTSALEAVQPSDSTKVEVNQISTLARHQRAHGPHPEVGRHSYNLRCAGVSLLELSL